MKIAKFGCILASHSHENGMKTILFRNGLFFKYSSLCFHVNGQKCYLKKKKWALTHRGNNHLIFLLLFKLKENLQLIGELALLVKLAPLACVICSVLLQEYYLPAFASAQKF